MIYLDNAATTFPKPGAVYDFVDKVNRSLAFNSGRGESRESQEATDLVEKARASVASLLPGLPYNRVVFTGSATDALNMIILGLEAGDGDTIYVSPFEHNAIVRPLRRLEKEAGVRVKILPFDWSTWEPDYATIDKMFAVNPPLAVFISAVSNVTGTILPYAGIFDLSKKYGSINVLDAAQALGIVPIANLETTDYLVFAGHKTMYGIFGVGGFCVLNDLELPPVICGGTGTESLNPNMPSDLPYRYEAGSRNVVAISSLIPSIAFLKLQNADLKAFKQIKDLASLLVAELSKIPDIHIYVKPGVESAGIVSFSVDGYRSDDIGLLLGQKGFSVRTGYHCSPLIHKFINSTQYGGAVRVSLGVFNTYDDIHNFIDCIRGFLCHSPI